MAKAKNKSVVTREIGSLKEGIKALVGELTDEKVSQFERRIQAIGAGVQSSNQSLKDAISDFRKEIAENSSRVSGVGDEVKTFKQALNAINRDVQGLKGASEKSSNDLKSLREKTGAMDIMNEEMVQSIDDLRKTPPKMVPEKKLSETVQSYVERETRRHVSQSISDVKNRLGGVEKYAAKAEGRIAEKHEDVSKTISDIQARLQSLSAKQSEISRHAAQMLSPLNDKIAGVEKNVYDSQKRAQADLSQRMSKATATIGEKTSAFEKSASELQKKMQSAYSKEISQAVTPISERLSALEKGTSSIKAQTSKLDVRKDIEAMQSRIQSLASAQGEFSKLIPEIPKNRGRIERLESLGKDIETIKSVIATLDVKSIENDIYREFEKMNAGIKEGSAKTRGVIENLEAEINNLKGKVRAADEMRQDIEKLDIHTIARDLEALRTRAKWLESTVEELKPVAEKLSSLESELSKLRVNVPAVIE